MVIWSLRLKKKRVNVNNNIFKIQNDLFFLSQKKTSLKIGMKNGASYQTRALNCTYT